MQQRGPGARHLALARPPGHLQVRLGQVRHRAGDAAVTVGEQSAMQVQWQRAVSAEMAFGREAARLPARRQADLLQQDRERDGEAVIDRSELDLREAATGVIERAAAQFHTAQHVSVTPSLTEFGAGRCTRRALDEAGRSLADVELAAIYDSFTITLTILLEEIGLAPRGQAGRLASEGHFGREGAMPLNLHGGLLSYGHCGVAGAMAHLAETHLQMTGRAGERQVPRAGTALLHGDGGVLSSHVSLFLEACA